MDLSLWKSIKKAKKLSYDDISKLSEIPKTTVTNIFCGYVETPRIDTVQAIEKALGINDSLFTSEDYANGVQNTKQVSITADDEDILDKYHKVEKLLGEKGKNLIIEFCDVIIDKFEK